MGMTIKDPVVHPMAREPAAGRSTTVTDAVRQALRAALERCPRTQPAAVIEARQEAIRALCARVSAGPEWRTSPARSWQDAVDDDNGLPR